MVFFFKTQPDPITALLVQGLWPHVSDPPPSSVASPLPVHCTLGLCCSSDAVVSCLWSFVPAVVTLHPWAPPSLQAWPLRLLLPHPCLPLESGSTSLGLHLLAVCPRCSPGRTQRCLRNMAVPRHLWTPEPWGRGGGALPTWDEQGSWPGSACGPCTKLGPAVTRVPAALPAWAGSSWASLQHREASNTATPSTWPRTGVHGGAGSLMVCKVTSEAMNQGPCPTCCPHASHHSACWAQRTHCGGDLSHCHHQPYPGLDPHTSWPCGQRPAYNCSPRPFWGRLPLRNAGRVPLQVH